MTQPANLAEAKRERYQKAVAARLERKKKKRVFEVISVGYVEDVYGSGTSFNIFSRFNESMRGKFYKSAYKLDTAKKYIKELREIKEKRELDM